MCKQKYQNNCQSCNLSLCDNIIKKYYCLLNCNSEGSNLQISNKISDKIMNDYFIKLYPKNCNKCNQLLCDETKLNNKCVYYCSTNITNFNLLYKISDNDLFFEIKSTYPNNCETCNKEIFKSLKIKYFCLFNCSSNIEPFQITDKISNESIINMCKQKYPNNCQSCNLSLCDKLKKNNICLFYCKNTISPDDDDFIMNLREINLNALSRYIESSCSNTCNKCKKIFKRNMTNQLYYYYANILFNDLKYLNSILTKYGFNTESTHEKAVKKIKENIFINIYDLLNKNYNNKHKTIKDLALYSVKEHKIFPLKEARNKHLEAFLQKLY